jgi:nicotinamide/nicotinate riboside kinase
MAIVVGIGGVSRAGKTFLAALISQSPTSLLIKTLHQDEFIKPIHEIPRIKDHIDWESPGSIDFQRYKNAILAATGQYDIVIAEGLLTFYDPQILQLFDKKIFISLSFDEFQLRKLTDLRWGSEPHWYIRHIWNSYLRYGQYLTHNAETLHIDGELDFNSKSVLEFIGI